MTTTACQPDPLVHTTLGAIQGTVEGDVVAFRGIPYAQAPVGALRFKPPQPAPAWLGVRDATRFAPAFSQLVDPDGPELGLDEIDEDALVLNVWAPRRPFKRRPVMVWIHGGALIEGSTRNPWYDGAQLAERGDVVVVTLQYRLGVFGFLNLAQVGGSEFADSGNVGLLDQALALRWVRDHIEAFGGDPSNVTLFGESAGGASVLLLMHMPAARGLFHKVISQSPSPQLGRRPERSDAIARQLMQLAGADSVEALQALSTRQLLDAELALMMTGLGPDAIWPTRGTPAVPLQATVAAVTGDVAHVPLIIGTTLDELCYWTELEGLPLFDRPEPVWQQQLSGVAGARLPEVHAAYAFADVAEPAEARRQHRLQITGDINFRLPAIRWAEAWAAAGQPVWMYLFSYRSTSTDQRFDSAHAMELPFLFGALDEPLARRFTGESAGREGLRDTMQQLWSRFAWQGDPALPGVLSWPAYTAAERFTLDINLRCELRQDPLGAQRQAWGYLPFNGDAPDEQAITRLTFSDE